MSFMRRMGDELGRRCCEFRSDLLEVGGCLVAVYSVGFWIMSRRLQPPVGFWMSTFICTCTLQT